LEVLCIGGPVEVFVESLGKVLEDRLRFIEPSHLDEHDRHVLSASLRLALQAMYIRGCNDSFALKSCLMV